MKILIAHNYYQIPGGEDAVARSEADLLRAFGQDVMVYHRHNNEIGRMNSLDRLSHLSSLGWNQRSYRQFRELLAARKPQVAHFHNIFYMMTPAVYQACRDEGVAVVQSLHNFRMMCSNGLFFRDGHVCEDCLEKNIWEGVKHRCFRNSLPMTLAMATTLHQQWQRRVWFDQVDRYIAAAQFTKQKYVQRGIPAERISVKPHFIHPEPKPRTQRGPYALYLGRLSQEKGVETLLEAWRSLKGFPLKIVGDGPLDQALRTQVHKENINAEFTGFLGPRECEEALRGCAFVVMPSLCYENFPRVVVEAFALGVPIVASNLGSLAELIGNNATGLLAEAGNSEQLAQKVRWLFENPTAIDQMGQNARKVFESKYSAQSNFEQLMRVYETAIERARTAVHG